MEASLYSTKQDEARAAGPDGAKVRLELPAPKCGERSIY